MSHLLEHDGHHALTAASGAEALGLLEEHTVHVALVDYAMRPMGGEELVPKIRARDPRIQVILQTGYAGAKPPREVLRELDIHGYHEKTEGPEKLLIWIDVATRAYSQLQQMGAPHVGAARISATVQDLRIETRAILAYATLLLKTRLSPHQDLMASIIQSHATTQRGLIDDLDRLMQGLGDAQTPGDRDVRGPTGDHSV